jgi:hypothetical protein
MACKLPPPGWKCSRNEGHAGPCAALPSQYSHRGWFGICPIYLGNLHSDAPAVAPRWELAVPLFVVSEWWQGACIYICTLVDPEYIPCWKFRITGEL